MIDRESEISRVQRSLAWWGRACSSSRRERLRLTKTGQPLPLYVVIGYDLRATGEHLIVPKLAATPIDVLLVASLYKNGQRNEPNRLILSPEPTVGKDDLTVLPSLIGLQFVRKL